MIDFFFTPIFWVICLITFLIRHFSFPFLPSTIFGVINFIWIYVLLGREATIALGVISGITWLVALVILELRKREFPELYKSLFTWALLASWSAVFLLYKFSDPTIAFNNWEILQLNLPAPIFTVFRLLAFSFVFIRLVDFINLVSWGGAKPLNPLGLAGYLLPFNMIGAGPICSYSEYLDINEKPVMNPSFDHLSRSIAIIVNGLFYKVVLAQGMKIMTYGLEGNISTQTWNDAAFLLIYIFFDFAGYSLIALGIGRLCGIPTPRNFNSPFLAETVTDFWVRWHMSLGSFVRRNIFTPLQLHLTRKFGVSAATFISFPVLISSFMFVGIWHKVTPEFLIWGLLVGCLMSIEKVVALKQPFWVSSQDKVIVYARKVLGILYVFITMTTGLYLIQSQMLPS